MTECCVRDCNTKIDEDEIFCKRCLKLRYRLLDFEWFLRNVYVLRTIKGERLYFNPTRAQLEVVEYLDRTLKSGARIKLAVLKGKRVGITELITAFIVWYTTIWSSYVDSPKRVDIIAPSGLQTEEAFKKKIKVAIEATPMLYSFVKGTRRDKKLLATEVEWQNDSMIKALTAGGDMKRGRSIDVKFFDEVAFMKRKDYDAIYTSTMSGDNHEIMVTTPSGMEGIFYDIWKHNSTYQKFYIPTFQLNDIALDLLERGEQRAITEDMIIEVNGVKVSGSHISKTECIEAFWVFSKVVIKREILGMWVSESDQYYPTHLVEYAFEHEPFVQQLTRLEVSERYPDYKKILIGVDWAQSLHSTVCYVIISNGQAYRLVEWHKWSKEDYDKQFDWVKDIYVKWDAYSPCSVNVYPDTTATQKMASDMLVKLGIPKDRVIPCNFRNQRKQMASSVFHLLSNHALFLPNIEELKRGLLSVDANLDGAKGHLADEVAALWCALIEAQPIEHMSNKPSGYSFELVNFFSDDD